MFSEQIGYTTNTKGTNLEMLVIMQAWILIRWYSYNNATDLRILPVAVWELGCPRMRLIIGS